MAAVGRVAYFRVAFLHHIWASYQIFAVVKRFVNFERFFCVNPVRGGPRRASHHGLAVLFFAETVYGFIVE